VDCFSFSTHCFKHSFNSASEAAPLLAAVALSVPVLIDRNCLLSEDEFAEELVGAWISDLVSEPAE
jgi:hypothetical protein